MNEVLKIFLSLSLSGSLVMLILFFCRRFWKDRISRQWQYYIWLIVVARLLLPFAPETNLVEGLFQNVGGAVTQPDNTLQEQENLYNFENASIHNMEYGRQGESRPSIRTAGSQPIRDIVTLMVNNIWLIIAFGLLIRKITVYQSFVHYVRAGQAGIKKPVELCVNPLISSPLLIGFFRPCIVLPGTDMSEQDFQYTVMHELTHERQRCRGVRKGAA